MFQDRCYDRDIDINNNYFADNMTNNIDMDYNASGMDVNMNYSNDNVSQQPIIEPMQERCVNRTIMHVVPHPCPFMYDISWKS